VGFTVHRGAVVGNCERFSTEVIGQLDTKLPCAYLPELCLPRCSRPMSLNNLPRINQRREVKADDIHLQFDTRARYWGLRTTLRAVGHECNAGFDRYAVLARGFPRRLFLTAIRPSPTSPANNNERVSGSGTAVVSVSV